MDLLGDVLSSLSVFSHSVGTFDMATPWGLDSSGMPSTYAFSYTVLEGSLWMGVEDAAPIQLKVGESALALGGVSHAYGSEPDGPRWSMVPFWLERGLPDLDEPRTGPITLVEGDGEPRTRLFTMAFTIQEPAHSPLLSVLPSLLVIPREAEGIDIWLDAAVRFCAAEERNIAPGFSATARHLTELIFSGFIRAYVAKSPPLSQSWLRGLSDPRIGRALAMMHQQPGAVWSAVGLATAVGMSRAHFTRAFVRLVGQSPIDYLIGCRMQLAADLLVGKKQSVGQVAEAVGYWSERAFRQAFRQRFGMSPRDYVKELTSSPLSLQ